MCRSHSVSVGAHFAPSFVLGIGISLFTKGFFLTRLEIPTQSTCNDFVPVPHGDGMGCGGFGWLPTSAGIGSTSINESAEAFCPPALKPHFCKLVFLVIDGWRYDFAASSTERGAAAGVAHHLSKMPLLAKRLIANGGAHENSTIPRQQSTHLFKFVADPPTVTMQRLKGILSGSLPTFLDASANFASTALREDNLIGQLERRDAAGHVAPARQRIFMGDDTWLGLFPTSFTTSFPFPSFNVRDLDTVDDGVIAHLPGAIAGTYGPWSVIVGHFLGVDHVGHRYNTPDHPAMATKLRQMDSVIDRVLDSVDSDTLVVVLGDHGMSGGGAHGGASSEEVEAALVMHANRRGLFKETHVRKGAEMGSVADTGSNSLSSHHGGAERDSRGSDAGVVVDIIDQTDLVPTLSLLLGTQIPYGSLGHAMPQVRYDASSDSESEACSGWMSVRAQRRNAQQIQRYVAHYHSLVAGFPEQVVSDLRLHFDAAERAWQSLLEPLELLLPVSDNHDSSRSWLGACGSFQGKPQPLRGSTGGGSRGSDAALFCTELRLTHELCFVQHTTTRLSPLESIRDALNTSALRGLSRQYSSFIALASSTCRKLWTQFDTTAMAYGIVACAISLLLLLVVVFTPAAQGVMPHAFPSLKEDLYTGLRCVSVAVAVHAFLQPITLALSLLNFVNSFAPMPGSRAVYEVLAVYPSSVSALGILVPVTNLFLPAVATTPLVSLHMSARFTVAVGIAAWCVVSLWMRTAAVQSAPHKPYPQNPATTLQHGATGTHERARGKETQPNKLPSVSLPVVGSLILIVLRCDTLFTNSFIVAEATVMFFLSAAATALAGWSALTLAPPSQRRRILYLTLACLLCLRCTWQREGWLWPFPPSRQQQLAAAAKEDPTGAAGLVGLVETGTGESNIGWIMEHAWSGLLLAQLLKLFLFVFLPYLQSAFCRSLVGWRSSNLDDSTEPGSSTRISEHVVQHCLIAAFWIAQANGWTEHHEPLRLWIPHAVYVISAVRITVACCDIVYTVLSRRSFPAGRCHAASIGAELQPVLHLVLGPGSVVPIAACAIHAHLLGLLHSYQTLDASVNADGGTSAADTATDTQAATSMPPHLSIRQAHHNSGLLYAPVVWVRELLGDNRLTSLLAVAWTAHHYYFATGHGNQFNTFHFSAPFVGYDQFYVVPSTAIMALNTFGSYLLLFVGFTGTLGAGSSHGLAARRLTDALALTLPQTLALLCTCIFCYIARRHLMVWAIFAPKFVFDALTTIVVHMCVYVSVILADSNVQQPGRPRMQGKTFSERDVAATRSRRTDATSSKSD